MKELRKGYKQTDIGVIPEDWRVETIGKIFSTFPTASYIREDLGVGNVKYIHYGDIHTRYDAIVFADQEPIPTIDEIKARRYTKLQDGDLILADASEDYAGIGKGIELLNCSKTTTISGLHTIPLRDKNQSYINGFRGYICQNKRVKQQLERQTVGTKVYSISYNSIKDCIIPIPLKSEQKAIAGVLSDIDSLIETLDKKIAKKRAIKEGAMQQLLTGEKRLAGFSEPWIEQHIQEMGVFISGNGFPIVHQGRLTGDYPFYKVSDFNNEGNENRLLKANNYISIETARLLSCNIIPGNAIVFAKIGAAIALERKKLSSVDCCIDNNMMAFIPNHDISSEYIWRVMQTIRFWDLTEATALPSLSGRQIGSIIKRIPSSLKEQQAIARILTDMDDEIEQLEKERSKYVALKQGAMQQLLTGQIRLVDAPAQLQPSVEIRTIPVDAHVVAGHIVNKLHGSKGWGRTKLQKSLHLLGYHCQLDFGNAYIRNTAGPDDQALMKHIDSKFRQFRHVRIEETNNGKGGKHYNYIPTTMIADIEHAFERYPAETQASMNSLLDKILTMDLARAEIVSTLYAVWNNRIIKSQPISDDLLLGDFYSWSAHKADFDRNLVLRALNYMQRENIVPIGWGKYIDKK